MKGCTVSRLYALALLLALSGSFPSRAADSGASTNWVENTITNLIEVRMARNRIVNEFRTNWIERVRTNAFDVYKTNYLTRNLTNRLVVDAWRTNSLNLFHTNWHQVMLTNALAINRVRTNFVESYRTNWTQLTLTNPVAVNLVRTNVVDLHKTNWQNLNLTNEIAVNRVHTNFVTTYTTNVQTFSLTNWQTVGVTKTNWVTQFVTNAVQLDIPKPVAVIQNTAEKGAGSGAGSSLHTAASSSAPNDDPVIEVSRTTKPPGNGLVEVELKIKWPADTVDAPPVQQWRIERGDGGFLSFGREQDFKKELPVGNYTVEARLQRDADSPSFLLRGTLAVTIKEAIVQQRTDRTKVASASER